MSSLHFCVPAPIAAHKQRIIYQCEIFFVCNKRTLRYIHAVVMDAGAGGSLLTLAQENKFKWWRRKMNRRQNMTMETGENGHETLGLANNNEARDINEHKLFTPPGAKAMDKGPPGISAEVWCWFLVGVFVANSWGGDVSPALDPPPNTRAWDRPWGLAQGQ